MSFKEKFELETMETAIMQLEERVQDLQAQSTNPEVLSDYKKSAEVLNQLALRQAELEQKFKRWAELEKKQKDSE